MLGLELVHEQPQRIVVLRDRTFYLTLDTRVENWEERDVYPVMLQAAQLRAIGPNRPRYARALEAVSLMRAEVEEPRGWHFSYLGGPDDVLRKIRSFAHTEFEELTLRGVAEAGPSLLLIGPHSPGVNGPMRDLVARDNVRWVGPKPYDSLKSYLRIMDVGLVPYADTPFNRGNFPLKLLEYLAAGHGVVATDLPVRSLARYRTRRHRKHPESVRRRRHAPCARGSSPGTYFCEARGSLRSTVGRSAPRTSAEAVGLA